MANNKSVLRRFLKISGIFLGIVALAFLSFLGIMSAMDYRPEPVEFVSISGTAQPFPDSARSFSFLSWNIGYAGLGKESDFFFDGGKGVRQTREITEKNARGIYDFLQANDSIDFMMLQEVDQDSKRTYYMDESAEISGLFPDRISSFALNYNCAFVPQPLGNPYGRCVAGLQSLSAYSPFSARRIALAADASWPVGLFMLDRCLLEWKYKLPGDRQLVVYNLHLSAYDDGTVKQQQMDTLKKYITAEYARGNYVVVGGDWNQYPPGYTVPVMKQKDAIAQIGVPADFPEPGWHWGVDRDTPSNRKLETPYDPEKTDRIVIDYFLTSPNIRIDRVKTVDLGFAYSDHQPVLMQVTLL